MKKCFVDGCLNEGTEFRDRTWGPVGDFRFYCKEHVKIADAKFEEELDELDELDE